jgi:hypothetical protein
MPDQYGFNHLGDSVRCIDCPTGGPLGHWPEHKRHQHARSHGNGAKQSAADLRRPRNLLAAPPTDSNEEKEATTMATTTPSKGEPAKQVAIDVLRKAGEPLHANEIAKRVLASGRCAGLKGKTPEATISAMLAVGSKPGGPFTRVDKGTYTLADPAATTSKPAQATTEKPAAVTKPAPTRKPARTQKPKRAAAKPRTAAKRSA